MINMYIMVPLYDETDTRLVENYYFIDERDSLISFAVLPVFRHEAKRSDNENLKVFLCGTADGGSQEVYKQVTSWRLRLQNEEPQIWVLSMEGRWIKLSKPRNSYRSRFRTLMITLQCLHVLKRRPEVSEKTIWRHEVFSSYDVRPSKDDLRDHVSLIKLFADRDQTLANSKLLSMLLKEKHEKEPTSCVVSETEAGETNPSIGCANNVEEEMKGIEDDKFEEKPGTFDPVCAICDDGGDILCCNGSCSRSFHATKPAGRKVGCESLGYSKTEVKAMQKFFCKNCEYKQHQCFACGKLGSSDETAEAEVFRCAFVSCGHFYHPECVAELLSQGNEAEARNFQRKVAAGESFTCPHHYCTVCGQGETKNIYELQFAICRRCPMSYHRKCLPRTISFEAHGQGSLQRAWSELLHKRIMIYCLKHEIDEKLGKPLRNHIIFPEMSDESKKWVHPETSETNKTKIFHLPRKHESDENLGEPSRNHTIFTETPKKSKTSICQKVSVKNKGKLPVRKRNLSEDLPKEPSSVEPYKLIEKLSHAVDNHCSGKSECTKEPHHISGKSECTREPHHIAKEVNVSKKRKASDHHRSQIKVSKKRKASEHSKSLINQTAVREVSGTIAGEEISASFPEIDSESTDRIKLLMYELSSLVESEDGYTESSIESSHTFSVKHTDVRIKQGKVEGSFEAILTTEHKRGDGELTKQKLIVSINYSTDETEEGKPGG
ncbi:protein ENHANCED DOWNY MILDEW 2-like isoform X2 [Asparagus officinalis]|uniref:protein ENHANCED DOWNY MILDEW 2-like isoform X2 n=1 Tax=Asparagus officinalis TaxID=4686 RepID=UPI00098E692F|nr:protein ENHANCED DOWNY MILDEW 2-like isoform X2 [Asparagus officinalis]